MTTSEWLQASVIINILGLMWSLYREMLIFDLSRKLSWISDQVIAVVRTSTSALEKLHSSVEHGKGDRSEFMATLKAIEDRLGALIRDSRGQSAAGVTIVQNLDKDDSVTFHGSIDRVGINSGSGKQDN